MVVGMAGFARYSLGSKALVCMAGGTGKWRMLAEQGEAGQRVIEGHIFLPADCIVTACAVGSKLAFVGIVVSVAANAGYRKLHDARRLLVTSGAGKRLVRAAKRKTCHRIVIETVLLPIAAIVATRAIGAVAALVHIILHVAGDTSARRLPDRIASAMARRATRSGVFPDKGKARIRVMIERGCFPARGRMAVCAIGAARAFVHIVPGVARDALGRRSGPALPCMA